MNTVMAIRDKWVESAAGGVGNSSRPTGSFRCRPRPFLEETIVVVKAKEKPQL